MTNFHHKLQSTENPIESDLLGLDGKREVIPVDFDVLPFRAGVRSALVDGGVRVEVP